MSSPEEIFAQPFHEDPQTVSEYLQNEAADTFNNMRAGFMPVAFAKQHMDAIEDMLTANGNGWFDRYGPPPPELADLYED